MKLPTLSRSVSFYSKSPIGESQLLGNIRSEKVKLEKVYGMCRRKRRGVAAVEFAIVAPIFFLLVLGMIEIGRMIMVQQILTNASREGARIAILDGTSTQMVKDKVNDYLATANISGAATVVSPDPPTSAAYGEPVTVTVSISANRISWVPKPKFAGNKQLQAVSVMRRETVQ
jgi:Flp pilus assembly protein TadG